MGHCQWLVPFMATFHRAWGRSVCTIGLVLFRISFYVCCSRASSHRAGSFSDPPSVRGCGNHMVYALPSVPVRIRVVGFTRGRFHTRACYVYCLALSWVITCLLAALKLKMQPTRLQMGARK